MHTDAVPAAGALLHVQVYAPDESFERTLSLDCAITIGRDPECDLQLSSPIVSRRHATLRKAAKGLAIVDHSANGTSIDGDLIRDDTRECEGPLTLQCGPFVLRLAVESDAEVEHLPQEVAISQDVPLALRRRLRDDLLEHLELDCAGRERCSDEVRRTRVEAALERVAELHRTELPRGDALAALLSSMRDEVLGLGPLEPLLRDPACSEIMVVDAATIFVERAGRLSLSDARFTDDVAVRSIIERIVTPLGRRIDESSPIVDARLPDGSRVHAVIPPVALRGPCITIRKFPHQHLTMARLVELGALSPAMAELLASAVIERRNIVISGGTGSGKTTLLNALSAAIPCGERVITIEDAAELRLQQPHVVAMEARPAGMQGAAGSVSVRDLVRASLRMRPDRIVVGECRGGEALDMLQAMNTGHEGSMTTTHANSPREALQRLETLCLMAGVELPLSAIRRQIAASVHVLVQQLRFPDGSRRVTSISEVLGLDEDGEVLQHAIYEYAGDMGPRCGEGASFRRTGYVPTFAAHRQSATAEG
jgi:pilus assembly protein CpaF